MAPGDSLSLPGVSSSRKSLCPENARGVADKPGASCQPHATSWDPASCQVSAQNLDPPPEAGFLGQWFPSDLGCKDGKCRSGEGVCTVLCAPLMGSPGVPSCEDLVPTQQMLPRAHQGPSTGRLRGVASVARTGHSLLLPCCPEQAPRVPGGPCWQGGRAPRSRMSGCPVNSSSSGPKPTSQHAVALPGGEMTPQWPLVPASQVTTGM